jgi:hypothetical protein
MQRKVVSYNWFNLWVASGEGGGGRKNKTVGITGISEYIKNVIHIFIDPDKGSDFLSPVVTLIMSICHISFA